MRNVKLYILAIIIINCVLFAGCSNTTTYENKYINNELEQSNLLKQLSLNSNNVLVANNVCVIDKNTTQSNDTKINAPVALLINRTDNKVIFAKNVFKKMYPASLTKVATALMAFNKFDDMKNEKVTISKEAASITEAGAKLCGFKEGDVINFYDLVTTMMIYSGNDAAYSVAEHIGNTQEKFCLDMTNMSKALGAAVTSFANPHGLHNDRQVITAYDMYLIFNRLLEYKEAYKVIGAPKIVLNYTDKNNIAKKKVFNTTNKYLLGQANIPQGIKILGGKTGTTNKAGNCLSLLVSSSDKTEYIAIILKANTQQQLYNEMTYLLGYINKVNTTSTQ